uniref:tetraspanin-33-like isoform X2 n=1 Tax=Myxine glutinosa TaxID=7769 RepID=UPI00358E95A2
MDATKSLNSSELLYSNQTLRHSGKNVLRSAIYIYSARGFAQAWRQGAWPRVPAAAWQVEGEPARASRPRPGKSSAGLPGRPGRARPGDRSASLIGGSAGHMITDPAVVVVVVGAMMFMVNFCGCLGSLRENITLLRLYAGVLVVIFLLQCVAGMAGFIFKSKVRAQVSEMVGKAIVLYREDPDLQNLIDYFQEEFECCGGVSYRDWLNNEYFACTKNSRSFEACGVPYSCCLRVDTGVVNTLCGSGMLKKTYFDIVKHIYTAGCTGKVEDEARKKLTLLAGLVLSVALIQFIAIILTCCFITSIESLRDNGQDFI